MPRSGFLLIAAGAVLVAVAFLPSPKPAICAAQDSECDPPSPDFNFGLFLPGLALVGVGWHALRRRGRVDREPPRDLVQR